LEPSSLHSHYRLAAEDEMVRTVTKKAKDVIVDAAQGVRTIAAKP
jgi:hypothetical protein